MLNQPARPALDTSASCWVGYTGHTNPIQGQSLKISWMSIHPAICIHSVTQDMLVTSKMNVSSTSVQLLRTPTSVIGCQSPGCMYAHYIPPKQDYAQRFKLRTDVKGHTEGISIYGQILPVSLASTSYFTSSH